jgi:hypothetical protein
MCTRGTVGRRKMSITRASDPLLSTFSSPCFGEEIVYDYGHWKESLRNKSDEDIGKSFLYYTVHNRTGTFPHFPVRKYNHLPGV